MRDFRSMAATMDQRVRQLAAEGIMGRELIHRMLGHLPDLQRIWVGASDRQLALLCQDYPGFYQYASLMEEAAQTEQANPRRPYLEMPELNDSLKPVLAALLTEAATLEGGYQAVIDAKNRRRTDIEFAELNRRHHQWLGDRERFVVMLKEAAVPVRALEVIVPALDQMEERIAQLEKRGIAD